jgi:hypothetical protein
MTILYPTETLEATNKPPASQTSSPDAQGINLLKNSDLQSGLAPWGTFTHYDAKATTSVQWDLVAGKPAILLDIQNNGKSGWYVQFGQGNFPVQGDHEYFLTFNARANVNTQFAIEFNGERRLAIEQQVNIGTTWQSYKISLKPITSDLHAGITFQGFGPSKMMSVWMADIRFIDPQGIPEPERFPMMESQGTVPLVLKSKSRKWSETSLKDFAQFLLDTEGKYWNNMSKYLRDKCGVTSLLSGASIGYSTPNVQTSLDIVNSEGIWQDPGYVSNIENYNWSVPNKSIIDSSGGILIDQAMRRVANKPFIVARYNHCFPSEFRSEAPIVAASMAEMQDWDGVFFDKYGKDTGGKIDGFLNISQHPGLMANMTVGSALYLRGDVLPAQKSLMIPYSAGTEVDAIVRKGSYGNIASALFRGVPRELGLRFGISLLTSSDPTVQPAPRDLPVIAVGTQAFVSDTNQLKWDMSGKNGGVFTAFTDRSIVIAGHSYGMIYDHANIRIRPGLTRNGWSTISLVQMDNKTFAEKGRMLAVLTGACENTGMQWKDATKSSLSALGELPTREEVVPAKIQFQCEPEEVQVYPLDEYGQRMQAIPVVTEQGRATARLGTPYNTIWYEIDVLK